MRAVDADVIHLMPLADTPSTPPPTRSANGAGQFLFVGRTDQFNNRRALLAFSIAAVPANASITNAALTLHLSRTSPGGTQPVAIHIMLADRGEGASNTNSPCDLGTATASGDATWPHSSQ